MNAHQPTEHTYFGDEEWALLGSGGTRPGISVYFPNTRQFNEIATYPAGESCYRMALDWCRRRAIAGTRTGRIRLVDFAADQQGRPANESKTFFQGAPVTALAFLGPNNLLAGDESGRCLLHDVHSCESKPPRLLTSLGAPVCVLTPYQSDSIAALSIGGRLVRFGVHGTGLEEALDLPRPSTLWFQSSVQTVNEAPTLLYPGQDGQLIYVDLDTGSYDQVRAHECEVAAITTAGDTVVSIGRCDGLAKRWRFLEPNPLCILKAPTNVASIASLDECGTNLLLLFSDGKAEVHAARGDTLVRSEALPGGDFRCVIGPPPEILSRVQESRKRALATQLTEEAERAQYHRHRAHFDLVCRRLSELGFDDTAASLHAQYAMAEDDPLREIAARKKLYDSGNVDEDSFSSLIRYADLLERWWQPAAALTVLKRCQSFRRDTVDPGRVAKLIETAQSFERPDRCIVTDMRLDTIMQISELVGVPFAGMWAFQSLKALRLRGVSIDPSRLPELLEKDIEKTGVETEVLRLQPLLTITEASSRTADALLIPIRRFPSSVVMYGMHWLPSHGGTLVEPFVAFDAGTSPGELRKHNRAIADAFRVCTEDPAIRCCAQTIHESIVDGLRRLVTQVANEREGAMP